MSLVYSYIRFSTKKQLEGDSLRRQLEAGEEWIRRSGHTAAHLTLHDLGIPAYRGQNAHRGALKRFLDLTEGGQVPPGSTLLIENLDRLSRQGVGEAYDLFRSILRAGVRIAVLRPFEHVYTSDSLNDLVGLLLPLMYFHLAYIESKNKSDRLRRLWDHKRQDAVAGKKFDRRRPSWLDWSGQDFVPNRGARAVEFIFRQTAAGLGQRTVLQKLQQDFPAIGRSKRWNLSFVKKVLDDRSVLGERQPHTFTADGRRVPSGPPLVDYYPAVVAEDLWRQAQDSRRQRRRQRRRQHSPASGFVNPFVGLLIDAVDGTHLHLHTSRGARGVKRRLASEAHTLKLAGGDPVTAPYPEFERAALRCLENIELADLEPGELLREILQREQKLASVVKRLDELQTALADPGGSEVRALISAAASMDQQRAELSEEIAERHAALRTERPLARLQELLCSLKTAGEAERGSLRLQLRSLIYDLVEGVYVKSEKHYGRVYCMAQVRFRVGAVKTIYFGPGFSGCDHHPTPALNTSVDLRDRQAASGSLFAALAATLVSPAAPVLPKKMPAVLGPAVELWLRVMRGRLPRQSYRTIPPKVARFVEYAGAGRLVMEIGDDLWSGFVARLKKSVRTGQLGMTTARVIHNRCREMLRWLGCDVSAAPAAKVLR